jgi:hypothetical protein
MKNKTLLIAAAALVAGVVSLEAQVYSANIVGYANVPLVAGYTLVANPLDDGNGNQLTNILSTLPNKSQLLQWNGTGYNTAIVKGASGWASNVQLSPGGGFFIKVASATTNTFVGTVGAVGLATGGTTTNALATGYNLVGSQIAFAGDATTDPNINLGTTLANKSQLLNWDTGLQGFDTAVIKGASGWGGTFPITVGEGFFVKPSSAVNWVQTLP